MRLIHVWSESDNSYPDPGYADGHTLGVYHGSAMADGFKDACDKVFYRGTGLIDGYDHFDPNYSRDKLTYWACPLFERVPQYV